MAHPSFYVVSRASIAQTSDRRPWQGMNWIWKVTRFAIYFRDGFRCLYCFRDLANAPAGHRSLDHLDPRCYGGENRPRNLITCCLSCNDSRSNRPWREFASPEAAARIDRHRRRRLRRYQFQARAMLAEGIAGALPPPATRR